jgi:hypothetical protein
MNVSPKGFHEGFLLKSGKNVVQVNLPKEHLRSFADGWAPDGEISVEVEAEEPWGTPAHKVFRLVRVVDNGGRKAEKDRHPPRKFSGRLERLNSHFTARSMEGFSNPEICFISSLRARGPSV